MWEHNRDSAYGSLRIWKLIVTHLTGPLGEAGDIDSVKFTYTHFLEPLFGCGGSIIAIAMIG